MPTKDNRSRYTDNEATNTSLGQLGSVFSDDTTAIIPPAGLVFIAITIVAADSKFASDDGLVPEDGDGQTYISTETASTSVTSGGTIIDVTNTFPAGLTMFGRWSKITLGDSSSIIAYVG